MATDQQKSDSAWSPLRQPVFAVLWLATVFSNVGTRMHDVGAGWLTTELSPSPLIVAEVPNLETLLAAARNDARLHLDQDPDLKTDRGGRLRTLLYLFKLNETVRLFHAA